ncbi:ribonucleoside hydrolase RihC [Listeria ilorinensis]|uniref:ribonucleoside hydrolase RihC n=1 Tax=Listeria ilorinensis TaxID=2867439 RepID=UPI001EF4E07A|nr:ribonucleoside hydrolase RihC [Listeria ilorinensis]
MKKIPLIIDTDPGIDDAVALAFAFHHPAIDLKLISTVAGNVNVDKTTDNALRLVEYFDVEVPVAKGCSEPLIKELEDCSEIHGESGMDGYDFGPITRKPLDVHAVEALRQTILASPDPVTLMPIAALTNIALLFKIYPETKANIKEIVLMGGSLARGNTTTAAEFNIFTDPEAAAIVFKAGLPLTMIGLDVTSKAVLTTTEIEKIKTMNQTGAMFASLFGHYRGGSMKTGLKMHDVCALAALVEPAIFSMQSTYVEVQTGDTAANGATVADLKMKYHTEANADVALEVDVERFRKWFLEMLALTK